MKKFLGIITSIRILPTLGPISVWIALFVLAPVGVIIFFSFLPADTAGEITAGISLKNYWLLFTGDTDYGNAILRSMLYAFITNMLCLGIGYPTAYWIARYGGRFKALLLFLVIAPSWSCYLVRIYALKQLVGYPGILNDFLLHLGVISSPINTLYTPTAVIFGLVYIWLPFMVLPIYASLEGINPALLEASLDLGASPGWQFWTVTLPLSKGGIFGGTILTFIPALGDWLVPLLIGGNKVWMAGNLIQHYFIVRGNLAIGSSMAVILTAAVVLLMYLCIKLGGEEAVERIV
ncbi:MAG: ABC transporter permease [Deltaproteobacteria bacterium]|nr:ABC transporter permease [Deltaproteobacteria bacterium]